MGFQLIRTTASSANEVKSVLGRFRIRKKEANCLGDNLIELLRKQFLLKIHQKRLNLYLPLEEEEVEGRM